MDAPRNFFARSTWPRRSHLCPLPIVALKVLKTVQTMTYAQQTLIAELVTSMQAVPSARFGVELSGAMYGAVPAASLLTPVSTTTHTECLRQVNLSKSIEKEHYTCTASTGQHTLPSRPRQP